MANQMEILSSMSSNEWEQLRDKVNAFHDTRRNSTSDQSASALVSASLSPIQNSKLSVNSKLCRDGGSAAVNILSSTAMAVPAQTRKSSKPSQPEKSDDSGVTRKSSRLSNKRNITPSSDITEPFDEPVVNQERNWEQCPVCDLQFEDAEKHRKTEHGKSNI